MLLRLGLRHGVKGERGEELLSRAKCHGSETLLGIAHGAPAAEQRRRQGVSVWPRRWWQWDSVGLGGERHGRVC